MSALNWAKVSAKHLYSFFVCASVSIMTFVCLSIISFFSITSINSVEICNQSSNSVTVDVALASGKRLFRASEERPMLDSVCRQKYFFPADADSFEIDYLGVQHRLEYMSGVDFLTSYQISLTQIGVSSNKDTRNRKYVDRFVQRTMEVLSALFLPYENGEPYWRNRFTEVSFES